MVNLPRYLISADAATLMQDAASRLLQWSQEAITARGVFHIALSGGSTPNALFRVMAGDAYRERYDWAHIHLWWSDERYLMVYDPQCNCVMAGTALIEHITIPPENVHRVRQELPALESATEYEAQIHQHISGDVVPRFDVILLGLGEDGHTASLFPGTVSQLPQDRLVVAHYVPKVSMWRVTFMPQLINAARHVAFLVSGAGKTDVIQRVTRGAYQPEELPAQLIAPQPGDLTWMLDTPAAVDL